MYSCIFEQMLATRIPTPSPPPPLKLTAMGMICQFNKLKPPKFKGGLDPLIYEEWLRRIESLFEVMNRARGLRCVWPLTNLNEKPVLVGHSHALSR